MCAKYWIPTTFGLGAVREQTYIHTYRYIKRNKNMDKNMDALKMLFIGSWKSNLKNESVK